LKDIFHVKSIYFYRDDYIKNSLKNNICTDYIAYRSETISSVKKSQSESMHVRFIDGFLHFIEDQIKYPNETLSELREETIRYLQDNKDKPKNDQIHSIAAYARKRLGLSQSSNENLLFLLEKSGAFIFEKELGEKIDAYSLWSEDDRAYIVLGNIKKS